MGLSGTFSGTNVYLTFSRACPASPAQRLGVQKARQMETPVPDQRFARKGELLFDPGRGVEGCRPSQSPTHWLVVEPYPAAKYESQLG